MTSSCSRSSIKKFSQRIKIYNSGQDLHSQLVPLKRSQLNSIALEHKCTLFSLLVNLESEADAIVNIQLSSKEYCGA